MTKLFRSYPLTPFFAKAWPYLIIALVGFAVYAQTLSYQYHYLDDNVLIKDNLYRLRDLSFIKKSFSEGVFHASQKAGIYYRPLLTVSYILDAQIGGDSLIVFHLTSVILHILASCLLVITLLKLDFSQMAAFLWGIIFCIHPVSLQAVAWLPGRNDILLAIFIFLCLISWFNYLKSGSRYYLFTVWLCYLLCLFTKETAVTIMPLLLLWQLLIRKTSPLSRQNILLGVTALAITIPWWILRDGVLDAPVSQYFDIKKSLSSNYPGIISYFGKLFFPFNLSVFPTLKDLPPYYGELALIIVFVLLYRSSGVNWRKVSFGACWFLLLLLPSLIRPVSSLSDFSEHRVYVPLWGIILIVSEINFPYLYPHRWFRPVSCLFIAAVISVFAFVNLTHAPVYQNGVTFWQNAVDHSPNSSFNRNNLGVMHYFADDYTAARRQWLRALELNPQEPLVNNNLGLIYLKQDDFARAEEYFLRELSIQPYHDNALFNLGIVYYRTKRIKGAIDMWQQTILHSPNYLDAYRLLAVVYREQNDLAKARTFALEFKRITGAVPPEIAGLISSPIDK